MSDPSFAEFLQKSPTLQNGIAQLSRDGIDVTWGAANGGTYLMPGNKVVIDGNSAGQGSRIARSLAHELGHHRFTERPDQTSKQSYVSTLLRGEAAATLSNAQVRREILDHGGQDIFISGSGDRPLRYQAIADKYLAGGLTRSAALEEIGEIFKTEQPSVGPHATYELYYGAHYNEYIAPRQRRRGVPEPSDSQPVASEELQPSKAGHADHRLYLQIKNGVEGLDATHGRSWDESSARLTASLLVLAKSEGLSQVDGVLLSRGTERVGPGERVFLVQGELDDPAHRRAGMTTSAATTAPESHSFAQVDALNRSPYLANTQLQDSPTVEQQNPDQTGPALSR